MTTPRLATPTQDGASLIEPPFAEWAEMLEHSDTYFAEWDATVGGLDAATLRARARRAFIEVACEYTQHLGVPGVEAVEPDPRIVVTGHQPELFHPGVWAKNFAIDITFRALRTV